MPDSILNGIVVKVLIILLGDIERNQETIQNNAQNCLSIFNTNIRCIRHKLYSINTNLLDFDIICFTETHLTADFTNIELEGYSVPFRKDYTAYSNNLLC